MTIVETTVVGGTNPGIHHKGSITRPLFRRVRLLLAGLAFAAALSVSLAGSHVDSALAATATGPTKTTRDAIIGRARNSVFGRWQAPAAGGWRYQRFTPGRWYTGEAYTQNNPQESWETFLSRMVHRQGAPGNDQGNDCSGFVSYAWSVPRLTTATIQYSPYAKKLSSYSKLRRGDVLVRRKDGAGHIAIFDRRLPGGQFLVYEQTPPQARHKVWTWSNATSRGYVPMRRVGIIEERVKPTGKITAPSSTKPRFSGDVLAISGSFKDNRAVSEVLFYVGVDSTPGAGKTVDAWRLAGADTRRGNGGYGLRWKNTAAAGSEIWIRAVPVDVTGNRGAVKTVGPIKVAYRPSLALTNESAQAADISLGTISHKFVKRISNTGTKTAVLADVRGELLTPGAGMVSRMAAEGARGTWDPKRSRDLVGDFDGDGDDDVLSLYDMDDADTAAYIRRSGSANEDPVLVWRSGPGSFNLPLSKTTVGDFDEDGMDDVAVLMPASGGGSEVRVLRPLLTKNSFRAWRNLGSSSAWDMKGASPAASDIDKDGDSDLIVSYSPPDKRTRMLVFKAWGRKAFATPREWWASSPDAWTAKRTSLHTYPGGASGDGIIATYRTAGGGLMAFRFASEGSRFQRTKLFTIPAAMLPVSSAMTPLVGDWNGDGTPDVGVARKRADEGVNVAIVTLGPAGPSLVDTWAKSSSKSFRHRNFRYLAGDVNGDGRDDIAGLYDAGFGRQRYLQLLSGKIAVFSGSGPVSIAPGATLRYSRTFRPSMRGTYLLRTSYKLSDGAWRVMGTPAGFPGLSTLIVR